MKAALDFIRRYGNLQSDAPPIMKGVAQPDIWHPYAHHYNYELEWRIKGCSAEESFAHEYRKLGIPEIARSQFEKLPLEEISDSNEWMLIDVGSRLGRRVTRPFAIEKPNVEIIMIDHFKEEELANQDHYAHIAAKEIAGLPLNKIECSGTVEQRVNEMLGANGYNNITYLDHSMIDEALPKIATRGRKVAVTGWKNPAGLGNSTCKLADKLNAEKLYLTNSALECIKPDSARFVPLKNYLADEFSAKEIDKIITLIHDPLAPRIEGKYNEKNPGERSFSLALRLLFVLAQKNMLPGYKVEISEATSRYHPGHYNMPGQNFKATRQE